MGRKIVCPSCNTIFDEDVLKAKNSENTCLVCNASLSDGDVNNKNLDDGLVTWWYLKDKRFDDDYSLWDKMPLNPEYFEVIQEFKAPPEKEVGLDEVKRILREYVPDAFSIKQENTPTVKCPKCGSKEVQLVPRKFSLLTGFATNKYDRMCVYCKKKF